MGKGLKNRFMARTLLGFGAFLASGTALSQDKPTHSLHTSTETMTLIGGEAYAQKLVEWAGMNVLLLTDQDINTLMSEKADASIVDELKKAHPLFPIESADKVTLVEMAAGIVMDTAPSAHGFKTKNAPENTHCVIVMPSSLREGKEWFGLASYQELETIENVNSPGRFWFSMFLAHEAHHCRIDMQAWDMLSKTEQQFERIQREANADQFALNVHSQEKTEYLNDWRQARAIGSMEDENWDYIFAGSLSNFSSSNTQDLNAREIFDSYIFIWKKISEHPSLDRSFVVFTQADFLFENLGTVTKDSEKFEREVLNATSKLNKYKRDENVSNKPELRVVEALLQKQIEELSNSGQPHKQVFAQIVPVSLRSVLEIDQVYEIVRDIHQKGGFDENPLARRNIELFLEGMQEHTPSITKQKPKSGLGT